MNHSTTPTPVTLPRRRAVRHAAEHDSTPRSALADTTFRLRSEVPTDAPWGSFQIEADGTIQQWFPVRRGVIGSALRGKNLFRDVLGLDDEPLASFHAVRETGRSFLERRRILYGRAARITLLHHEKSDQYWAILETD